MAIITLQYDRCQEENANSEFLSTPESIKYVDKAIPEKEVDKYTAWIRLHYDALFKGSDASKKDSYKKYEAKLREKGVDVIYFPYTTGVSSSEIKKYIR